MTIYYEQQLLIEQAKQAKKDRELALELKSRKLYPSEQRIVDEVMCDIKSINRDLDASMRKNDNSSSSSRRTSLGKSLIDKHYEQAMANKYGRTGRKEGRAISTSNQSKIDDHISTVKYHARSLVTAADDFANTMQGSETPYAGSDPGRPDAGQQEGKNRKGRYTSSSFNYEVKAFDQPGTLQRERKSLGIPQGMRDWDHKGFTRELERKLGVK